MTTFRIKHSKNYTVISNDAIRDKTLSLRARGLHHLLLSYQDDWVVNEKHLVASTDKEGREAIRAAIRELESAGYLVRTQGRSTGTGKFAAATYDVFELPQPVGAVAQKPAHGTVAQKTDVGSPDIGLAVDGLTDDGKPDDIISTNSTKYLEVTKYLPSESGGGQAENHGADIRRFESRFNPEPEPPWVTGKHGYRRTYDQGFRKHLTGYLSGLTCNKDKTITVADSDTWLNAANFPGRPEGQKRLADAYVRWDDYQTRQAAPPNQALERNTMTAQQAIAAELAQQIQEIAS